MAALAPWYARFGTQARLVNMYGITETTVHVTYRPLAPEDVRSPHRSPIGIPFRTSPCICWTTGWTRAGGHARRAVRGRGRARGRLSRPSGADCRPFRARSLRTARQRLYLSGDRAVRRADGTLDYLGRGDGQVKIRGFRIELGEIEARLRAEPGVSDVVVIVRTDAAGQSLAG